MIPRQRVGTAEDTARVVQFLVSEESDFITGQIISVDGGLSLSGTGIDHSLAPLKSSDGVCDSLDYRQKFPSMLEIRENAL